MTEINEKQKAKITAYEKGDVERVNGILKGEFFLNKFPTKELAYKTIKQSIKIYNESRLHQSIYYKIF